MRGLRSILLACALGLLLAGSGCVAVFFFNCASDFDCLPDEFCDLNGVCVSVFFLNEKDTCTAETSCETEASPDDGMGAESAP